MAQKKVRKHRRQRKCESCGKKTRAKQIIVDAILCKNCREEHIGYLETIDEFADLDPGGPAAYIRSGDESKLRRGYW